MIDSHVRTMFCCVLLFATNIENITDFRQSNNIDLDTSSIHMQLNMCRSFCLIKCDSITVDARVERISSLFQIVSSLKTYMIRLSVTR
jgi:hypothetical protein